MRTYSSDASPEIRDLLAQLALPPERTGPEAYRAAMTRLGELFVRVHAGRFTGIDQLLLICTNEDADYLARGALAGLEASGGPARLLLE
jgi:hypothetical protein